MDDLSTTELVARALRGDESAWEALVRRYGDVIWAATSKFRLDRDTRAEVFQMTCLHLLDHLESVREPEKLAGWLWTTARHECLAVIRERSRTRPYPDLDTVRGGWAPDFDAGMMRDETVRAVCEALEHLDERCQQLLRLLVADPPLTYEEIAEVMSFPIGSIGPTRARCLDKLGRQRSIRRITARTASSDRTGGTP